jgi:hypothetical protein
MGQVYRARDTKLGRELYYAEQSQLLAVSCVSAELARRSRALSL